MRRLCGLLLSLLGSLAAARKVLMAMAFTACLISTQHLSAAVPFSRDWAATWGLGWINDRGQSIATDSAGNLYVAGINEPEYYLRKYSPAGIELWTRTVTTGYVSFGGFIDAWVVIDASDHPILAGTMNVGAGPAPLDLFVAKFDPAGTQLWLRTFDADGDNDVVTVEYAADGTQLWSSTYDGDLNGDDVPRDLVLIPDGRVFVLARSRVQLQTDFGQLYEGFRLLLLQYGTDGTPLSAEVDGGSDDGAMLTRCGASIAVVGTSAYASATGYDVSVRKYSPVQRSRIRRHLRMP